ncbi:hypothetical protein M758_UG203100 [Ceratodon purpureus]|nr:hypothetical protein M758_UG203100 [Ceratodon purpureus]
MRSRYPIKFASFNKFSSLELLGIRNFGLQFFLVGLKSWARPQYGRVYIGSLISLTSKSKICYEGFLYIVDTENFNIVLQKE